jgi:hypothetical protein
MARTPTRPPFTPGPNTPGAPVQRGGNPRMQPPIARAEGGVAKKGANHVNAPQPMMKKTMSRVAAPVDGGGVKKRATVRTAR